MSEAPRWHAALCYAVLGRIPDGLPEPGGVDLSRLLADLDARWPGGLAAINAELAVRRERREPSPVVPDDLRAGLAPAQFASALAAIRQELQTAAPTRVRAPRDLDADERRLQAEVPPHHGG